MEPAPDIIYAKDSPDKGDESRIILSPLGHLNFVDKDCDNIGQVLMKVNGALVRRLDLSFNRIRSLNGLENCPNVEELILDNNELTDDLDFPIELHRLNTLMINKNNITTLGDFLDKIEDKLPNLTYLSLLGNEACPNQLSDREKGEADYQRYRHYVLYRLPQLKFLDSSPVKESEKKAARRIADQLEAIRKVKAEPGISVDDPPEAPSMYTPLPSNTKSTGGQNATFGKSRYVYYGKHSEGNRFIRNSDL